MITTNNTTKVHKKIMQQHAVVMRHKMATLLAFTTTIFFLCIENVKAFAVPLSNEKTLLFLASGAHSMAERWKKNGTSNVGASLQASIKALSSRSANSMKTVAFVRPTATPRTQLNSGTALRAFSFASSPSPPAPQMLDMKTSINAFGSWYNQMDPVAKPPVYDDYDTEYTFSSGGAAESWPSTYDDEVTKSLPQRRATRAQKRINPVRRIRKIAGWVVHSSPLSRSAPGLGTTTL